MKKRERTVLLSTVVLLLAGCSQAVGTFGPIGSSALNYTQTTISRVGTKTNTPTSTPTSTKTWIPSNTPTIGPPPDLELFDVKILPETFTERALEYSVLGRIRNNTNQTMLLHNGITAFKFVFEIWEYDERLLLSHDPPFTHLLYEEETSNHNSHSQKVMNCILYPGEEGVFNYYTDSHRGLEEYLLLESVEEYDGPLGLWYSYESYYEHRPDLPMNLHPKAENIKFVRDQASFKFEYNIVGMPQKIDSVHSVRFYTWIVLYDKNGNIINILQKMLNFLPGFDYSENYRVMGNTADVNNYYAFDRWTDMTQDMIDAVDHIDVLLEFIEGGICGDGKY